MLEIFRPQVERLAKSSIYQYGDSTSFSVPVYPGIALPGRLSPHQYLNDIGCASLPAEVLVVCPANGGLIAELLSRGVKKVTAIEPRHRFHNPLKEVMALVAKGLKAQGKPGGFTLLEDWPTEDNPCGKFDLIIWPEGLNEITRPKQVLRGLVACLKPGGVFVVEMTHGKHDWVDQINAWYPRGDVWIRVANELFGQQWSRKTQGRRDNSLVYTLDLPGGLETTVTAPTKIPSKPKKEPAPKKAAAKKAAPKKKKPQPKAEAPVEQPETEDAPPKPPVSAARRRLNKKKKPAAKKPEPVSPESALEPEVEPADSEQEDLVVILDQEESTQPAVAEGEKSESATLELASSAPKKKSSKKKKKAKKTS